MLQYITNVLVVILTLTNECTMNKFSTNVGCEVRARTQAGWVCGRRQFSGNCPYASFYNVPYARQPTGERRFKELEPVQPWDDLYDATKLGPICPQLVDVYGRLMTNKNASEACIHANVYVPLHALRNRTTKLRILVFIHGGGFVAGSGDPDLHGPEYLVKKDIIVITFNYRLHIFGFLSLNSPSIPGNNGLRDAVTLLKWVRANARNFGGDPHDVTLAGQSAGAACAHLLTLSKAAEGLFKRTILMSGGALRGFFTPSPKYAKDIANLYISSLGINATDPEEIHRQLIDMPLETLITATTPVVSQFYPTSFGPVIETKYSNITTIIDQDPESLLNNGQGNNIPLIIGFANLEDKFSISSLRENNVLKRIQMNPLIMVPSEIPYKLTRKKALKIARQTEHKYFNGMPTVEKYSKYLADSFAIYPAIKLSQVRSTSNSAPVFLYYFNFNASFSAVKVAKNVTYDGASHTDDLTFIFKTNSMKGVKGFEPPTCRDTKMRQLMTSFVKNFMSCSAPICQRCSSRSWPAEKPCLRRYEKIVEPDNIYYTEITKDQEDTLQYFDSIYNEE